MKKIFVKIVQQKTYVNTLYILIDSEINFYCDFLCEIRNCNYYNMNFVHFSPITLFYFTLTTSFSQAQHYTTLSALYK